MKSFEKLLFVYSIVAVTVIFICFGIFEPKPINLITSTLLIPIVFYFWVKLTGPEKSSPEIWSIRFLIVIIILCLMGIGTYYLKTNQKGPQEKIIIINATTVPSPITSAKPSPDPIKPKTDESVTDILYGTPIPIPTTFLKTKGGIVNVYQDKLTTSKILYKLIPDQSYPYSQKLGAWYKVYISDSIEGWVESSSVSIIQ